MADNLSISPERHEDAKRPIIDKSTLIPIGFVIGLAFGIFQAAAQWTTLQLRVLQAEQANARNERRLDTVEATMVFWRREVERKLGPLPDYKPGALREGDERGREEKTAMLATQQQQRKE